MSADKPAMHIFKAIHAYEAQQNADGVTTVQLMTPVMRAHSERYHEVTTGLVERFSVSEVIDQKKDELVDAIHNLKITFSAGSNLAAGMPAFARRDKWTVGTLKYGAKPFPVFTIGAVLEAMACVYKMVTGDEDLELTPELAGVNRTEIVRAFQRLMVDEQAKIMEERPMDCCYKKEMQKNRVAWGALEKNPLHYDDRFQGYFKAPKSKKTVAFFKELITFIEMRYDMLAVKAETVANKQTVVNLQKAEGDLVNMSSNLLAESQLSQGESVANGKGDHVTEAQFAEASKINANVLANLAGMKGVETNTVDRSWLTRAMSNLTKFLEAPSDDDDSKRGTKRRATGPANKRRKRKSKKQMQAEREESSEESSDIDNLSTPSTPREVSPTPAPVAFRGKGAAYLAKKESDEISDDEDEEEQATQAPQRKLNELESDLDFVLGGIDESPRA